MYAPSYNVWSATFLEKTLNQRFIHFLTSQSALHATELIKTLNMAAKPFLGRYLRYEVARAFRTLLVSYRLVTRV